MKLAVLSIFFVIAVDYSDALFYSPHFYGSSIIVIVLSNELLELLSRGHRQRALYILGSLAWSATNLVDARYAAHPLSPCCLLLMARIICTHPLQARVIVHASHIVKLRGLASLGHLTCLIECIGARSV